MKLIQCEHMKDDDIANERISPSFTSIITKQEVVFVHICAACLRDFNREAKETLGRLKCPQPSDL